MRLSARVGLDLRQVSMSNPRSDNQSIRRSLQAGLDNRAMPLTRFTLRQLEAFVVVADLHSFSAAAERLGLTAQAISQLVAEFEATLEFKLFDRTTRRVDLSSAGRDYLASVQTVLRHVQAAETAADDLRNRAAGLVRVGAPLVLAATALPAAIKAYQSAAPEGGGEDPRHSGGQPGRRRGGGGCRLCRGPGPGHRRGGDQPAAVRQSLGAVVRSRAPAGPAAPGALERPARRSRWWPPDTTTSAASRRCA